MPAVGIESGINYAPADDRRSGSGKITAAEAPAQKTETRPEFRLVAQTHRSSDGKKVEGFIWSDGRWREECSIDRRLPEIMVAFHENQVLIVEAATGAGKTIRLPQALLLDDPEAKIYITQLKRVAVTWNSARAAWEMGEAVGGVVGYKLRGEQAAVGPKTRETFLIDQSLVNQVVREGKLPEGVLFIDEAHERSISTDLLLGLVRTYLPNSPQTKVVIASATIDTQKFNQYFEGSKVFSVEGSRPNYVETSVLELNYGEHHTQGAIRGALGVLERFSKGDLEIKDDESGTKSRKVSQGGLAVLLPGKDDIREAVRALEVEVKRLGLESRVQISTCHGETTREERDRILADPPPGVLKVVVGTEIIRTSVTIPYWDVLVDSLQIKRPMTDARGVAHLEKIAISQAESEQGRGRLGRVKTGLYIPISYRGEYTHLDKWPTPDIKREPLSSVVLQVAATGFNARDFPFIDRPEEAKLNVTFERLKKIGALSDEEKITPTGLDLLKLPLDPERAMMILTAEKLGILPEAIILAAILEHESIYFSPNPKSVTKVTMDRETLERVFKKMDQRLDMEKLPGWVSKGLAEGKFVLDFSHYDVPYRWDARKISRVVWEKFTDESDSDFVAEVNALRAFLGERKRLRDLRDKNGNRLGSTEIGRRMNLWCQENFIQYKRLNDFVLPSAEQILEDLGGFNGRAVSFRDIATSRKFSSEALTKVVVSGHVDHVVRKQGRYSGHYQGPLSDDLILGESTFCPSDSELIVVGGARRGTGRGEGRHYADLAAPVKPEWLKEVLSQLCQDKPIANSAEYNPESGQVEYKLEINFGHLNVGERTEVSEGPNAVGVFARALAGGRVDLPVLKTNEEQRAFLNDLWRRAVGNI